jgi:hypothetical protein
MVPESKNTEAIATPKPIGTGARGLLRSLGAFTAREKQQLMSEMVQVKGLMPLLMSSAIIRAGLSRTGPSSPRT